MIHIYTRPKFCSQSAYCIIKHSCCLQILAKAEHLNPGGSIKDRVALEIIQAALIDGTLAKEGLVAEGTAGSTGISLALLAKAVGCKCFIAMPDDAASEKARLLQACHRAKFISEEPECL